MFNSKWIGIINWDDGIYYNNTNIKKQNIKKNTISNSKIIKDTNKLNDNKIIENYKVKNIENEENIKDIYTNKDILENINNFDFKNSIIPYYNENIEYLQSNNINNKYNNNYYKLLDRMSNISRFILKGNDYYRLYISKNSNKYFNNIEDVNNINYNNKNNENFNSLQNYNNKNNKQFSKINIVYQEIERQTNDENNYNEEY